MRPIGILIRKIQCQVIKVVMNPPSGGPITGAISPGQTIRPIALIIWCFGVSRSTTRRPTGDMNAAAALLGRPYSISGHVIHGRKLGRKLGASTPGGDDGLRTVTTSHSDDVGPVIGSLRVIASGRVRGTTPRELALRETLGNCTETLSIRRASATLLENKYR